MNKICIINPGTANARDSARIIREVYTSECKRRKVRFLPKQAMRHIYEAMSKNPFDMDLSELKGVSTGF